MFVSVRLGVYSARVCLRACLCVRAMLSSAHAVFLSHPSRSLSQHAHVLSPCYRKYRVQHTGSHIQASQYKHRPETP